MSRGTLARRPERGFTLTELMVSLAVAMFLISGAMLMVVASARSGRHSQQRSDLQRGGRATLTLLMRDVENAGLGLPRRLAFGEGSKTSLTVASLDLVREWTVSATSGTTSGGTITLASAVPAPSTVDLDMPLAGGEWVFLYANATIDATAAGASGHGLLQLAPPGREQGTTSITIGNTAWPSAAPVASAQLAFDLNQSLTGGGATGSAHPLVLLRAHTGSFSLNTDDPNHEYLTYSENGQAPDPVVRDVDNFELGYYVDANCDGLADDTNADGAIDWSDTVASPFALRVSPCVGADPTAKPEVQVTAVEVHLTLRTETKDANTNDYERETFGLVIPTRNINTTAQSYIFIDNGGVCTRNGGC